MIIVRTLRRDIAKYNKIEDDVSTDSQVAVVSLSRNIYIKLIYFCIFNYLSK